MERTQKALLLLHGTDGGHALHGLREVAEDRAPGCLAIAKKWSKQTQDTCPGLTASSRRKSRVAGRYLWLEAMLRFEGSNPV